MHRRTSGPWAGRRDRDHDRVRAALEGGLGVNRDGAVAIGELPSVGEIEVCDQELVDARVGAQRLRMQAADAAGTDQRHPHGRAVLGTLQDTRRPYHLRPA